MHRRTWDLATGLFICSYSILLSAKLVVENAHVIVCIGKVGINLKGIIVFSECIVILTQR